MKFHKEMALTIALILTMLSAWGAAFLQDCEQAQESLLRLHIIAASDEELDQNLKLAVRDRVLQETELWFSTEQSKEEAEAVLQSHLQEITAIAKDELSRHDCDDSVKVELCHSSFPQKSYETFTLPAGDYDALRIIIGEGKGQNWWCVLFPGLCIPSASAESAQWFADQGLDVLQQQTAYEPRFALAEWWNRLLAEKR